MKKLACPNKRCGGMLEFDYGNGYGNFYTCNVDMKQHILPTALQLREHPDRYIVEKLGSGIVRVLFVNSAKRSKKV